MRFQCGGTASAASNASTAEPTRDQSTQTTTATDDGPRTAASLDRSLIEGQQQQLSYQNRFDSICMSRGPLRPFTGERLLRLARSDNFFWSADDTVDASGPDRAQ